jgi:hypothetical protein
MCPIPKGIRDRGTSLYTTLYRGATRHILQNLQSALMLMVEFSKRYYTR